MPRKLCDKGECLRFDLEAENGRLRGVLRQARDKLRAFYEDTQGRYPGGPLYGDLMRAIDERLAQ